MRVLHTVRAAGPLVALGLLLPAVTGCGGSIFPGPNADPEGLFPRHYAEKAFVEPGTRLMSATAATAGTTTYAFDFDVPTHQAFALVVNCTSGTVTAMSAARRCHGGPAGLLETCAGGHFHLIVHVSRQQRHTWGIAVYRTPRCQPVG